MTASCDDEADADNVDVTTEFKARLNCYKWNNRNEQKATNFLTKLKLIAEQQKLKLKQNSNAFEY